MLRQAETPTAVTFRRLARTERIAVGDVVLLEVLQGSSSEARARITERWLRSFEVVGMLDDSLAAAASGHYRRLRGLGVTPRSLADLVIATWCIAQAVPLLQRDRDFAPMAEHLGLRLVTPD